jgi:hypothetical protein
VAARIANRGAGKRRCDRQWLPLGRIVEGTRHVGASVLATIANDFRTRTFRSQPQVLLPQFLTFWIKLQQT